jgi:hypothetical protein
MQYTSKNMNSTKQWLVRNNLQTESKDYKSIIRTAPNKRLATTRN